MFLPTALLFLATFFAAVMAYGTWEGWVRYSHGFEFILFAKRFQWPMTGLSLLLCVGLLALVISGKRRAWWLIGLGPVLALFVHKFSTDPSNRFVAIEDPAFVAATDATFVGDGDWVVGVRFADGEYAYPYAALYDTPIVVQSDHDQRMALMWSAYANRALAVRIGRELRAADLDVVSMPANALIVYNSRIGQFINVVTGRTPRGETPDGFKGELAVTKTTWGAWRERYPETKVLSPASPEYVSAPRGPIRPAFPMPRKLGDPPAPAEPVGVTVVHGKPPVVVPGAQVGDSPLNLAAGQQTPVLLFRDKTTGEVRAFERRLDDLRPQFKLNPDPKRKKVVFVDSDTPAGWDANGRVVDGPAELRGKRLPALIVEDGVYWHVLKHWQPSLEMTEVGK